MPMHEQNNIKKIFEEIEKYASRQKNFFNAIDSYESMQLNVLPQIKIIDDKKIYDVNEFLHFEDKQFIKNAYIGILKRDVDITSFEHYLHLLRTQGRTKKEILGILLSSAEGQSKGVFIKGLEDEKNFKSKIKRRLKKIKNYFRFNQKIRNLEIELEILKSEQGEINDAFQKAINKKTTATKVLHLLTKQKRDYKKVLKIYSKEFSYMYEYASNLHLKLSHLIEVLEQKVCDEETKKIIKELKDNRFDSFYASLEQRFIEDEKMINQYRQQYFPYLNNLPQSNAASFLLDLGSGLGLWLKLLKQEGYLAQGVDSNNILVNALCNDGIDVAYEEPLLYLKRCQESTYSSITGFHFLEQLSFNKILELFDEALRVLVSGGVVIFELYSSDKNVTKALNPCYKTFFTPEMAKFIAITRGFIDVEIRYIISNTDKQEGFFTLIGFKA